MGFGERLRRERELRGVKLEEIAESTKISTRYLRALEDEDLDRLPGGIFSKGFVRAYARYLGIDEEQAVADFVGMAGEPAVALPDPPPPPPKPQVETHYSRWWVVAAVVVLAVVGYYLRERGYWGDPQAPPPQTEQSAQSEVKTPEPARPQTTPASSASEAAASTASIPKTAVPAPIDTAEPSADKPAETGVVVELRVTHPAWIEWTIDGGAAHDAVFAPGTQKRLSGKEQVRVKLGDAAAVELTYNGKAVGPVGSAQQVKTVTFTSEGMQQ